MLFYGVGRFIVDFWKEDIIILFGLNMGQLLSLIMVIIAGYFLIKYYRESFKRIF